MQKTQIIIPSILPPARRIIVIGDIHGDYNATILALKKANLIDSRRHWAGKDTIVVQLGDQVDRKTRANITSDEDSEFKIMNLFDRLHKEAKKENGAVYSLLGNHEIMNVLGDYTYTSNLGNKHFKDGQRYEHFKPGGKIAIKMAKTRTVIMKIGDWIFVHGGITPHLATRYKIGEINRMMREFLMGNSKLMNNSHFRELFLNQGSLLWTRRYSEEHPDCRGLMITLGILKAKYMVVGHTPQNKINSKCRGHIWRIDVGMSKAFGEKSNENTQVLEIINNGEKVRIL